MMRKLQKKNKAFAGKVYFEVYFKPQSGRPLLGGIKFRTYKTNLFNLLNSVAETNNKFQNVAYKS